MIGLLQRVSEASISVGGDVLDEIGQGLLVLVGIEKADTEATARRLVERLLTYRVFPDAEGRMNLSVTDIQGGLLLVPQFTLAADTRKGTRPGFSTAASPDKANQLFDYLGKQACQEHTRVGLGCFGADMQIALINDGPVTFLLKA